MPSATNGKSPTHTVVKFPNTKYEEEFLETSREKPKKIAQGIKLRLASETLDRRGRKSIVFKTVRENNVQSEILCPTGPLSVRESESKEKDTFRFTRTKNLCLPHILSEEVT